MATIDKTKSRTYNFLSENKSIEDIKNQANIEVKEKRRHGGKTFKLVEKNNDNIQEDINALLENNTENLEPVTSNLINNRLGAKLR